MVCDVTLQIESKAVRVGKEQKSVGSSKHLDDWLWEVVNYQSKAAQYFYIVVQVFDHHLLLFLHGDLGDIVSHEHRANALIIFELGLHDSHQEIDTLFEVLHKLFLVIEHI